MKKNSLMDNFQKKNIYLILDLKLVASSYFCNLEKKSPPNKQIPGI